MSYDLGDRLNNFDSLDSLIDKAKKKNIKFLILDIDEFIREFNLDSGIEHYFVDQNTLKELAKDFGKTEDEVLNEHIFPTNGSIISGDFGELLFQLIYSKTHNVDFFHYRWRSKQSANQSVPGSDLLGGTFIDDVSSPNHGDTLYVIEVKSGWVNENENILQKGYDSLEKDQNGRVGKSLFAIARRMKDLDSNCDTSKVARFMNLNKYPVFEKKMIIAAGVKEENWDDAHIDNLIMKEFKPDDIVVLVMKSPWDKIQGLFKK